MTTTLKSSSHGSNRTLDIDRLDGNNVRLLTRSARTAKCIYVNGPALRDALLEAFPLEDGQTVPGSGKDEPEFLDVVPGMVIVDRNWDGRYRRVTLPDGRYYNYEVGVFGDWTYRAPRAEEYKVVFDPRGAKALPNPLGIRVGDTVRKVRHDGAATITTEFVVNHIGVTGSLEAQYGPAFRPEGFEVVSREVPDRLPAGTITWNVQLETSHITLRTDDGYIRLSDGAVEKDDTLIETLVRSGKHAVIYLPES